MTGEGHRSSATWEPLTPAEAGDLLGGAGFRWYVAGGHALELAVGRSWRRHDDLDVGVLRHELAVVHEHLASGWGLYVAAAGELTAWDGRRLAASRDENNVWVSSAAGGPFVLDLLVGGGDDEAWWSRWDHAVRVLWHEAVRHAGGIPHLAPHLQLLMKAKHVRPKDDKDASEVIPVLGDRERRWLSAALPTGHVWQPLLDDVD